jgi:penicillin amidase
MRRSVRYLGFAALALAGVLLLAAAAGWFTLRGSLAALDGSVAIAGLSDRVTVTRDAAGVPTVTAQNPRDLVRALGFLHAQDRYFQMDLMRRAAAGELAALLGPDVLASDRQLRPHRFRDVARAAVAGLDAPSRALLDAYVGGVNAGLDALRSRPFEYWLLNSAPQPWSAEDTVLCVHAMFLQLQDYEGHGQLQRGLLHAALPEALWRFLDAGAPEWDAAVDGSRVLDPLVPRADEYDLRTLPDLPVHPPAEFTRQLELGGSNNWAVAGALSEHGAAVVANDMHLDFRVPNIWYRARLVQRAGAAFDATGVTLPGTPAIVAGSNGSIAWGFTNSYGSFATVIRLIADPTDASAYLTAAGAQHLERIDEPIVVHGGATVHLAVAQTPWGPVIGNDWEGRPYVLQWSAHDPSAVNLNQMQLEHAGSVQEAVRAAAGFGIPAQNLLVADRAGHIGWVLAGRLPKRPAGSGLPQLSTDPAVGFAGWLDPQDQPQRIDPPEGILWSANARVIGGADALLIGDDGMDRGARAAQIHADLLASARPFKPRDSLAIQLDDRAVFLERWRVLLGELIERNRAQGHHEHDGAREVLRQWSGHAAPTDPAYRLVEAFRAQTEARAFFMLIGAARRAAPQFRFEIPSSFEGPLWRLLKERPANLLAAEYPAWDALLLEALTAAEQLPGACRSLAACTWGEVNAVRIAHPLSAAVPILAEFLDMPTVRVPGAHSDMPRIQGPDYGASERFSVAPGQEIDGYFHMPGGQSGHPLSPFYRAGFVAWAMGLPAPFLPTAGAHTLELIPQTR